MNLDGSCGEKPQLVAMFMIKIRVTFLCIKEERTILIGRNCKFCTQPFIEAVFVEPLGRKALQINPF